MEALSETTTLEGLAALLDDETAADLLAPYVPEGTTPEGLAAIGKTFAGLLADVPEVRRALFGEPHPDVEAETRKATVKLFVELASARAVLLLAKQFLTEPAVIEDAPSRAERLPLLLRDIGEALQPGADRDMYLLVHAAGAVASWLSFFVQRGEQLGNLDMRKAAELVRHAESLGLTTLYGLRSVTYQGWTITPQSSATSPGDQAWRVKWYHPERGTQVDGPLPDVTDWEGAVAYARSRIDSLLAGQWGA